MTLIAQPMRPDAVIASGDLTDCRLIPERRTDRRHRSIVIPNIHFRDVRHGFYLPVDPR